MKAYEKMENNENLGWCKNYASSSYRVECVITEGDVVSLRIDGQEVNPTSDNLKRAADIAIQDSRLSYAADDFTDESSGAVIGETCMELGCRACPWRDECDAMHVDEDELQAWESIDHDEW